jgi:hypothetical protein
MFSFRRNLAGSLRRFMPSTRVARPGSASSIARNTVAHLPFGHPYHARLIEQYLTEVVRALRATGTRVSPESLIQYMSPDELLDLSYDLPRTAGVRLRTYLSDLPAQFTPVISAARDRLLGPFTSVRATPGRTPIP